MHDAFSALAHRASSSSYTTRILPGAEDEISDDTVTHNALRARSKWYRSALHAMAMQAAGGDQHVCGLANHIWRHIFSFLGNTFPNYGPCYDDGAEDADIAAQAALFPVRLVCRAFNTVFKLNPALPDKIILGRTFGKEQLRNLMEMMHSITGLTHIRTVCSPQYTEATLALLKTTRLSSLCTLSYSKKPFCFQVSEGVCAAAP